jgi:flavodoxin short chain
MANVLIVYGASSTEGNTEWIADHLLHLFKLNGAHAIAKPAVEVDAAGLCDGQDLVLFGASSWVGEENDMQEDMSQLYQELDQAGVAGTRVAVFGPGDKRYGDAFCIAVDHLEKKLRELGAEIATGPLKIDGDPRVQPETIKAWAEKLM